MTREELIQQKKKKHLSVARLSELSGVPAGTITKIISGETKKPRPATLKALEKILKDEQTPADIYPHDAENNLSFSYAATTNKKESQMVCERALSYGIPKKDQGTYTFADLECIPEGRYAELIDGVIYDMATPVYIHQRIAMEMYMMFRQFIDSRKGRCEVFVNAFGVFADNDDKSYLIPDLSVVCNPDIIKSTGIYGPPDFIVEILSPSTEYRDRNHKFYKYSQCGVKEYWIIDIEKRMVVAYRFFGSFTHYIGPMKGKLDVAIYDGELQIDLDFLAKLIDENKARL